MTLTASQCTSEVGGTSQPKSPLASHTNQNIRNADHVQMSSNRLRLISLAQGVKRLSIGKGTKHDIQPKPSGHSRESHSLRASLSPAHNIRLSDDKSTAMGVPCHLTESGRQLTFCESASVLTPFRKSGQITPSSSKPGISILGIFAAKKMTHKFLAALTEGGLRNRAQSRLSKLSTSLSSASFSLRIRPPTYQLGPSYVFRPLALQPQLESLLEVRALAQPAQEYNPNRAASLCKNLVNEVKMIMRSSAPDR
ncbi:hypothetical protein P879_03002 [Paragonimus westermani]|uniref:Uncharacterized protein n=1 Tax=Paragonimus westermani TaxID=34504 RepID=A0A8T0DFV8_9TREM|nr:hypothetical protein P879_03002 [Paragonimus westermani]